MPRLDADNPLIVGHALHKGIESGLEAMEHDYFDSFPVITEEQENEMMKLRIMLPKVTAYLDRFEGCKIEHEVQIVAPDFIGFADLIITAPDGTSMVMDFKYSNSVDNYLTSGQLHLYKWYLDHAGYNVKRLQYLFIPKTSIRQLKQTKTHNAEDLWDFRKRITKTVEAFEVNPVTVEYDENEVIYFQNTIREIEAATEYPKNPNGDCFACNPRFASEYLDALEQHTYNNKGQTQEVQLMPIPKNVRREKQLDLSPDTWLYGASYVGKSVFWDSFPDVFMINTDGNIDNTTAPYDFIRDEVKKEGRMIKRKFAWEVFMDDLQEMEAGAAKEQGYKTVVIDLVEDLFDSCRMFVLQEHGWEHETDGGYGKGWDIVTTTFHNAMKRLKALGLQIVFISREATNQVTLKAGQVRTTYSPNVKEKVVNFLTGVVDLTIRAYVNDQDEHMLQLKKEPNTVGGGRYDFRVNEVPLERDAFLEALANAKPIKSDRDEDAKVAVAKFPKAEEAMKAADEPAEKPKRRTLKAKTVEEPAEEVTQESAQEQDDDLTPPGEGEAVTEPEPEAPKRRQRKTRSVAETDEQAALKAEAETTPGVADEKPVRRRRRRTQED